MGELGSRVRLNHLLGALRNEGPGRSRLSALPLPEVLPRAARVGRRRRLSGPRGRARSAAARPDGHGHGGRRVRLRDPDRRRGRSGQPHALARHRMAAAGRRLGSRRRDDELRSDPRRRSEEHTSELQSHVNLVCRLLLEKKNKNIYSFYTSKTKKKNKKY